MATFSSVWMNGQDPFRNEPKEVADASGKSSAGVPPAIFLPTSEKLIKRSRGRLPHWEVRGAVYFVTFRLSDSLPRTALERIKATRGDILATAVQMRRNLTPIEHRRLKILHARKVEALLDAGTGACHLKKPAVAKCVAEALRHFDGKRYQLYAWCVMPNHVHVVFRTIAAAPWKTYCIRGNHIPRRRQTDCLEGRENSGSMNILIT